MALSSEPNDQDATPPKPTEDQLRLARAALNPLTDMQRRAVIAVVAYETVQELVAPSEQRYCPKCHGKGYDEIEWCDRCGGTGFIPKGCSK